jgi:hypothetical protein
MSLKKEEIVAAFGELLETGKAFVTEVVERTKNGKKVFDYQFAQKRERAIAPELSGIAFIRSNFGADAVLISWVNGVTEEDHKRLVASGDVSEAYDSKRNYVPVECKNLTLNVIETTNFDPKRHIYMSAKEGKVVVSTPKMNPQTGTFPTADGKPIFRTVVPTEISLNVKDRIVTADGSFDKEELGNWQNAMLKANAKLVEALEA